MATAFQTFSLEGRSSVPAAEVRVWIREILEAAGVSERLLAQGIAMSEAQFHRLASGRSGAVKATTLYPLRRAGALVEEGRKTLTPKGFQEWVVTPSPYLNDVPPILCLRSDSELQKVLSTLAAIRYGFPA